MNNFAAALLFACFLSALIGTIEIVSRSKVASLWNCLTGRFVLYVIILSIGNVFTTAVASAINSPIAEPKTASAAAATHADQGQATSATNWYAGVVQRMPWFWYGVL